MPTHEYNCEDCGYKSDEKCPKCDSRVQRLISGGGSIIFKNSGFYATDYGSSTSPTCGRERPCCGRDTPCDKKPCESQITINNYSKY